MIDGSEKRNRQLAFELHNSHVCEKRRNRLRFYLNIHTLTEAIDNNIRASAILYS